MLKKIRNLLNEVLSPDLVEWCFTVCYCFFTSSECQSKFQADKQVSGEFMSVSFINYLILFFSMILPFRSIFIHHINTSVVRKYYIFTNIN